MFFNAMLPTSVLLLVAYETSHSQTAYLTLSNDFTILLNFKFYSNLYNYLVCL